MNYNDLISKKKKLSWLLRNNSFCYNADNNGFIDINELLKRYYNYKEQEIRDDIYYCHYIWKPHDKKSYAKFNSIDHMIKDKFVLPTQYITPEEYMLLANNFIQTYLPHYTNLTKDDCIIIQQNYPNEFLLDITKRKIRAIRSWENK